MVPTNTKSEKDKVTAILSEKEQQVLILEEIQKFIKLGRERGALSIEEINELLPQEITLAAIIDQFMQALEVNGVVITDNSESKSEDEESSLFEDGSSEDDERDEEEDSDPRANDPVRLYLK